MISKKVIFFSIISSVLCMSCSFVSTDQKYLEAESFFQKGETWIALKKFKEVSQKDPDGTMGKRALFREAQILDLYLNKTKEAVSLYEKLVFKTKDFFVREKILERLLEISFKKFKDFKKTIFYGNELLAFLVDKKKKAHVQFQIGKAFLRLKVFKKAFKRFRHVASMNVPQWSEKAAYMQAVVYFIRGGESATSFLVIQKDFKKAVSLLKRFLKKYPHSFLKEEALLVLASCYEELDQVKDAYGIYQTFLKKTSKSALETIALRRMKWLKWRAQKRKIHIYDTLSP